MIDALLRASFLERGAKEAALKALEFIRAKLWKKDHLLHRYRDGDARFKGTFSDYAYLIQALITAYEATGDAKHYEWAVELADLVQALFLSPSGAFYEAEEDENIILRKIDFFDNAEGSANAVHAENLLRLYQLTWDEKYLNRAEGIIKAAHDAILSHSLEAAPFFTVLLRYHDLKAGSFWVVLDKKESLKEEIKELFLSSFLPHQEILWQNDRAAFPTEKKELIAGKTTFYFCNKQSCESGRSNLTEIREQVNSLSCI